MIPQDNTHEQKENLEEMNYSPDEDIFNQEEHISLDGNGNPVEKDEMKNRLGDDLDVPGSGADDAMEAIGSEDEENNFYSLSDNEDNHEETNEDLLP